MSVDEPTPVSRWVRVEIPDLPWAIEVQLGGLKGRIGLIGLRLEPVDPRRPVEISEPELRRLPVRDLPSRALEKLGGGVPIDAGRRKWVEVHYEGIARAYEEATTSGQAPSKLIQKRWRVSRGTAVAWIARARELRYLHDAPSEDGDSRRRR